MCYKKKPNFLKLSLNEDTNKVLVTANKLKFKSKKEMELIFNTPGDFSHFIFQIKRLVFNSTKKNLVTGLQQ